MSRTHPKEIDCYVKLPICCGGQRRRRDAWNPPFIDKNKQKYNPPPPNELHYLRLNSSLCMRFIYILEYLVQPPANKWFYSFFDSKNRSTHTATYMIGREGGGGTTCASFSHPYCNVTPTWATERMPLVANSGRVWTRAFLLTFEHCLALHRRRGADNLDVLDTGARRQRHSGKMNQKNVFFFFFF